MKRLLEIMRDGREELGFQEFVFSSLFDAVRVFDQVAEEERYHQQEREAQQVALSQ
ncbi:MAG: hypothetical protein ACE5I7_03205 [Candidatus Binatia bacterium]